MVRLVSTAACLVALAGRTAALRAKTAVIALELNATLLNATLDAASNATTPADAPRSTTAAVPAEKDAAAKDAANDAAKTEAGVVHFDGPFRQEMQNHWDLQYTASLKVGGQQVQGILDTGSFDLLVFSRGCGNCGAAAAYDEHRSQDVKFGKRNRDQNYGSGSCTAVDALDKVQVGNAVVPQQDMWMAKDCQMPVLESASFSAIVGIGPPGHLRRAADNRLSETKKLEEAYISDGMEVPPTVKDSIRQAHEDIEDSAKKVELLMSLGVQRISACYGRHAGSPAWLVWNDIKRAGEPGVYQVPIKGILTWGVQMGAVGLMDESGKQSAMSCQDGCGAIIDTGTSLIGVPSIIYNRITEELSPDGDTVDCGSISRMPRLLVTLGGKAFHLHPSTYVGKMYNSLNQESVGFMRSTTEAERQPAMRCSLLLMDLGGRKTQFGPMFILGIPFMREFYTTFDLGTGPEDRSLFLSAANDQCSPDGKTVEVDRRERRLLTVDASKIRVPDWVKSNEHYMTI